MNENILTLLKMNHIDQSAFIEMFRDEKVVRYEEYDSSLSRFAIYGESKKEKVDITRVLGTFNYILENDNFLDNFSLLFDPNGDSYHSRANGMLKYSSEELASKLDGSFTVEPIKVYKIKDDYFIDGNGVHRYFLFRMHSLMNKYLNKSSEYEVPVISNELDYIKTYANFIGSLLWDEKFYVYQHYDENYSFTGKARVSYKKENYIMSDNELIDFMREKINSIRNMDESYYSDVIFGIWNQLRWEKNGLLKSFIQMYLPELERLSEIEDYNLLEDEMDSFVLGDRKYGNN